MPTMNALKKSLVEKVEGGYRITLEVDGGEKTEIFATVTQISFLIDELEIAIDHELPASSEEQED